MVRVKQTRQPNRVSRKMVRLVGFEPTTSTFAGSRSIQLSYKRIKISGAEGEI